MAPTTATKPTKRATSKSSVDYLADALDDLGKARDQGGKELRSTIDDAMERIRRAREDMGSRDWQHMLDDAAEDARRELGRMAIRAQRTPQALTELSREVRKRREALQS
jgi:uncharacterized protein YicC (UPF0701 family)